MRGCGDVLNQGNSLKKKNAHFNRQSTNETFDGTSPDIDSGTARGGMGSSYNNRQQMIALGASCQQPQSRGSIGIAPIYQGSNCGSRLGTTLQKGGNNTQTPMRSYAKISVVPAQQVSVYPTNSMLNNS